LAWVRETDEERMFLSVVTIGELRKGIARLPESQRRKKLETWVRRDLVGRFTGRILSIDLDVAERWGQLVGASERRGVRLPVIDSLIAATSLSHKLLIVTRNTRDFERCGGECHNPWTS
jgi:predicted nucleic acid-binding protein